MVAISHETSGIVMFISEKARITQHPLGRLAQCYHLHIKSGVSLKKRQKTRVIIVFPHKKILAMVGNDTGYKIISRVI